jgi:hypothetical protein
MDFMRSRTGAAVCAIGVLTALAVFLFMPFSDGTGTGAKLFFSVVLGGFAAFGAWSFAGIPALVRDLVGLVRGRGKPRARSSVQHQGPLPELSAHRQRELRRQVRVMAAQGLFVPEVPDAALLFAGVAERDAPVKPDVILDAIGEVDYYHPGADARRWLGNLAMHDSKAEQDEEAQIADIVRLAGGALDVRDIAVRYSAVAGHPRIRQVDIGMTVNGAAVTLGYVGHSKYLSTHIHHALAVRLRDGGSGKRLAALWVADQGVWLSVLADGAVAALNAELKLGARSDLAWSWVDEEEGFAAGEEQIRSGLA